MDNKISILEDVVRSSYSSVVWTHKIQEKQADLYLKSYKCLETIRIISSSVTSVGIISLLFIDELWVKLFSTIVSLISAIISALFKSFNTQDLSIANKKAAVDLLEIRDKYQHLLLTVRAGEKSYDELDKEYVALEEEKHIIYKTLPQTTDKAKDMASVALKISKDNEFPDSEVNSYLPKSLHI
jgi:hypothetical protein